MIYSDLLTDEDIYVLESEFSLIDSDLVDTMFEGVTITPRTFKRLKQSGFRILREYDFLCETLPDGAGYNQYRRTQLPKKIRQKTRSYDNFIHRLDRTNFMLHYLQEDAVTKGNRYLNNLFNIVKYESDY